MSHQRQLCCAPFSISSASVWSNSFACRHTSSSGSLLFPRVIGTRTTVWNCFSVEQIILHLCILWCNIHRMQVCKFRVPGKHYWFYSLTVIVKAEFSLCVCDITNISSELINEWLFFTYYGLLPVLFRNMFSLNYILYIFIFIYLNVLSNIALKLRAYSHTPGHSW